MGEKMAKYYQLAEQKGGMAARMRMALKTSIPSTEAGSTPDTPELLEKFYQVAKEIIGADVPKL